MSNPDRFLVPIKGCYNYVRRVPKRIRHLDARIRVKTTLQTQSIEIARMRRDALETADDLYWVALVNGTSSRQEDTTARYKAAQARAIALGFIYRTTDELVASGNIPEIMDRIAALEHSGGQAAPEFTALMGGVERPRVSLSNAMQGYLDEIAPLELTNSSAAQKKNYRKVKLRAINNFIELVGDKLIDDISREDAIRFHDWWRARVTGPQRLSGNTANRDMGNLSKLFRVHFERLGQEGRPNPFRNLRFKDRKLDKKPAKPFPSGWIQNKILVPGAMDGLNRQARLIVLALINTGCRPSEICNCPPSRNFSTAKIPYLRLAHDKNRALKTDSSVRDIPLVGVSLAAMRQAPTGFPKYLDKETNLSACLMHYFRKNKLFPDGDYSIYSFRHSFERRMKEAEIDFEIRCILMGHSNTRPNYGDGVPLDVMQGHVEKVSFDAPEGLIF